MPPPKTRTIIAKVVHVADLGMTRFLAINLFIADNSVTSSVVRPHLLALAIRDLRRRDAFSQDFLDVRLDKPFSKQFSKSLLLQVGNVFMRMHLAPGVVSSLSNDNWFEFFDKEQRSPNNHLKLRRSIIAVSKTILAHGRTSAKVLAKEMAGGRVKSGKTRNGAVVLAKKRANHSTDFPLDLATRIGQERGHGMYIAVLRSRDASFPANERNLAHAQTVYDFLIERVPIVSLSCFSKIRTDKGREVCDCPDNSFRTDFCEASTIYLKMQDISEIIDGLEYDRKFFTYSSQGITVLGYKLTSWGFSVPFQDA
ncbi:hypothetical protein EAG_07353 [Camponotus floridanus]|uniref:Uncharacterized protein n=1 Tax=Camponotus floridanus TaxID=104421 RepID=E2AFG2_CAMFO|nr:hypothetical protein EAG_07353 [Camponotus floridanus]